MGGVTYAVIYVSKDGVQAILVSARILLVAVFDNVKSEHASVKRVVQVVEKHVTFGHVNYGFK